jgi:hypothetical protein
MIGKTITNKVTTTATPGHPSSHKILALEIKWLCSAAPNNRVVKNGSPLAGNRNSSAAIDIAKARSRLRPVKRSRPKPQTWQSSTAARRGRRVCTVAQWRQLWR